MLLPNRIGVSLGLLLIALLSTAALAQNNGGQNNGPGGFGPGNLPDPQQVQQMLQQFRQRQMDNLKQQMGASDEEFAILQPKIQKVLDQQQSSGPQRLMMRAFIRNSQFAQYAGILGDQQTPVMLAADDLQKLLDNPAANPEAIKVKLDTLRQVKAKAREDLVAAYEDLKTLLTLRQEAVLVSNGILE